MIRVYHYPNRLVNPSGYPYWAWNTQAKEGYWSNDSYGQTKDESSGFTEATITDHGWCLLLDNDYAVDIGL